MFRIVQSYTTLLCEPYLTLKAQSKICSKRHSKEIIFFPENKPWNFIHIKCQDLFPKKNKYIFKVSSAALVIGALRVNIPKYSPRYDTAKEFHPDKKLGQTNPKQFDQGLHCLPVRQHNLDRSTCPDNTTLKFNVLINLISSSLTKNVGFMFLTLSTLGKYFSRRHTEIFFLVS